MENLTTNPEYAKQLAMMQKAYDAELAEIKAKVVWHGYENYPVLFDRTIPGQKLAPPRS